MKSLSSLCLIFFTIPYFAWSLANGIYEDPTQSSVVLLLDSLGSKCSGVVVGYKPLTVITAAHCLLDGEGRNTSLIPLGQPYLEKQPIHSFRAFFMKEWLAIPEVNRVKSFYKEIKLLNKEIHDFLMSKSPQIILEKDFPIEIKDKQKKIKEIKDDINKTIEQLGAHPEAGLYDLSVVVFPATFSFTDEELKTKIKTGLLSVLSQEQNKQNLKDKQIQLMGYGLTGTQLRSEIALKMAYNKVDESPREGPLLASYSFLINDLEKRSGYLFAEGYFGSSLKGDSGGAVFDDRRSLVAIMSRIDYKELDSSERKEPQSIAVPRQFESVQVNYFYFLQSPEARNLLREATTHGAHILGFN